MFANVSNIIFRRALIMQPGYATAYVQGLKTKSGSRHVFSCSLGLWLTQLPCVLRCCWKKFVVIEFCNNCSLWSAYECWSSCCIRTVRRCRTSKLLWRWLISLALMTRTGTGYWIKFQVFPGCSVFHCISARSARPIVICAEILFYFCKSDSLRVRKLHGFIKKYHMFWFKKSLAVRQNFRCL